MLTQLGAQVRGYSRHDTSFSTLFPANAIAAIWGSDLGDIVDTQNLSRAVLDFKPDLVFHLAAQSRVSEGYRDPIETYRTNVLGTASVLQSCLDSRTIKGCLLYTSPSPRDS